MLPWGKRWKIIKGNQLISQGLLYTLLLITWEAHHSGSNETGLTLRTWPKKYHCKAPLLKLAWNFVMVQPLSFHWITVCDVSFSFFKPSTKLSKSNSNWRCASVKKLLQSFCERVSVCCCCYKCRESVSVSFSVLWLVLQLLKQGYRNFLLYLMKMTGIINLQVG